MFYSISYYKADKSFAYCDNRTFTKVDNALIRATLHLQAHADEIRRANVIYQGKNVQKVVRAIALLNLEPKFK
jgi:hypothetical protein